MSEYTRIICFATRTDRGDPKANEEYVLNSHHQLGDKAVEVFNVPIAGVNIEDLYSATREALIKLESELITNTRKYIVMDVTTYYLMLSDPQAFTAIPHNTGLGEVKLFSATVLRCEDSWNFSCALRRSPDLCNVIANVNFEDITASKKSEKVDSDSVQAVTETKEESERVSNGKPKIILMGSGSKDGLNTSVWVIGYDPRNRPMPIREEINKGNGDRRIANITGETMPEALASEIYLAITDVYRYYGYPCIHVFSTKRVRLTMLASNDLMCCMRDKGVNFIEDETISENEPIVDIKDADRVITGDKKTASAKKETLGKLRYDLIPVSSLEELCKVYTYGVEKYGDRNWEKGLPWLTCFAAIMRHLLSWVQGVDVDRESGCKHLAHVAWWCFALMWYARKGKGVDDRDKDSSAEGVVEFESVAVGEGTE